MPNETANPATNRPDAKLVHPLKKLQGIIRRFVIYDVILFITLFFVLWFWLGVAVDYGLFKLLRADIAQQYTPVIRVLILAAVTLTLLTMAILRVRGMLTKDLSLPALALILEKRYPKVLGGRLITAIEMADERKVKREGYSVSLVRNTIEEARQRIDQVNVNSVFNWGRLRGKFLFILGVCLVGLLTAFALHAWSCGAVQPAFAWKKFADVSGIWTERNVLIQNTPWPRRAHLEIVDFDDDGHANELRVGKGAPIPPKVAAKAYKWVVAAPGTYDGWRPLQVQDLAKFGIATPPGFVLEATDEHGIPTRLDVFPEPGLLLDDIETKFGTSPTGAALFEQLTAASDDLNNTRKLRRLVVPEALALRYDVISTRSRIDLPLKLDSTGKFSNDIPGLAESVRFIVSAEDFSTARRTITVVAPPTFVDLYRDELQPGYLHHAAPVLSKQDTEPMGPFATANPLAIGNPQFALRGVRQSRPNQKISITSDRSLFSVPIGTELTIAGEADKDLKAIELKPVTPNVKATFLTFPAMNSNRKFTVTFDGKNPIRQLDKPTEFQLVMTDTDNVTSTRTLAIQAIDDAPPSVDVIVDPIVRRLGGYLLVTPRAMIPFLPDSKISDDNGLSNVRFEFRKEEDEATSLVVARAMAASTLSTASQSPLTSFGLPITVATHQRLFNTNFGSTIPVKDASGNEKLPGFPLPRFEDQYALIPKKNRSRIQAESQAELVVDGNQIAQSLKSIKLTDLKSDAFDLQRYLPTLEEKDTAKIQPRYKLEVFVVAQDTNVELTNKDGLPLPPKTSKNLDPIRIQVVSEADLLVEVGKDEEMQRVRMEDILKKATEAQSKLSQELSRLNGVTRNNAALNQQDIEQIKNAQVRVTDLLQDVAKARDILTTMRSEYEKLYRELDINRVNDANMKQYSDPELRNPGYLDILKRIFDKSLPTAEQSLNNFAAPLGTTQRPTDEAMLEARTNYAAFLRDLDDLVTKIGFGQGINDARKQLQQIINDQLVTGKSINLELESLRVRNLIPDFTVPRVIQVQAGKTVKVKVTAVWKFFAGTEAYVALDVPATSEIKAPKEFTIKQGANDLDRTEYEFEITAGTKTGLQTLRLLPGPFLPKVAIRPVELNVEVTK